MDHISLPITTKFEKVEQINSEFTRCRCTIMALGKNRNGSHFSRESVEDAIPTFKNIPVIAYLYEGDDGNMHVAGHEMKLVERDGDLQFVTKCVPYGTVPDGEFTFEEVTEADGTKATYLTADVILWSGKYPEIMDAVYSDDVYYGQSMEIRCLETKEFAADPRYTDITKFSASALCLLGKSDDKDYHVEPCFPSSSVMPYSFDSQFTELMEEFKFALAECFKNNDDASEVKEMNNELIAAILAEFNLTIEQIDFEITEDMTEEILREKLASYNAGGEPSNEPNSEPNGEPADPIDQQNFEPIDESTNEPANKPAIEEPAMTCSANKQFSTTYMQKRELLQEVLNDVWITDDANDHYEYFWLMDFDDEYMFVERSAWMEDKYIDGVGRFAYTWNEETKSASITAAFEEMFIKWLTADELAAIGREKEEFEAYKASHTYENSEVEELKEFKAARVAEEHKSQVEAILEEFEDLNDNEEFKALRENAINFENLEELETACYAIRGKTMKEKFSATKKKKTSTTVPVVNTIKSTDEVYGGLFSMYGNKN